MNLRKGWQDMSGCTLYMNCGNDGRGASPNFRTFDSACTAAAYACGSDLACARDYVVRSMLKLLSGVRLPDGHFVRIPHGDSDADHHEDAPHFNVFSQLKFRSQQWSI